MMYEMANDVSKGGFGHLTCQVSARANRTDAALGYHKQPMSKFSVLRVNQFESANGSEKSVANLSCRR
jgi:hypothetical protein